MTKRIIAIVLLCAMALSLVACVNDPESPETTAPGTKAPSTTGSEATTEPETTANPHADPGLPSQTFGGRDFRFLGNDEYSGDDGAGYARDLIYLEDVQTNSINEAVRDRNNYVQDTYDVVIKAVWLNKNDPAQMVKKSVDTNLAIAEFVSTNFTAFATMIDGNSVVDLNSLNYLDLTKEYWNQDCVRDMSVAHRLFFVAGDILTTDKEGCWSIQFNRDLIVNNQLESPYDHVDAGTWTYDDMYAYASAVSDYSAHDPSDIFGITWGVATETGNTYYVWQGGGTKIITKDPLTDLPMTSEFTDDSYDSMLKTALVQFTTGVTILQSNTKTSSNSEGIIKLFKEGHALFKVGSVSMVEWMREYEADFGVLPLPKLKQEQTRYYTTQSSTYAYAIGMPASVLPENRDFASIICEALCCESTATVLKGYYDQTLLYKGLRKEEDERMLDMIFQNRVYDLSLVFSWASALMDDIRGAKTEKKVKNVKNTFESYSRSINKSIDDFLVKHGMK